MSIIGYLIVGLIAGAIAKAILPGRQGGGWLATMILGIIGAIVGGFLGNMLFGVDLGNMGDFRTWILAILGSLVCLFVYGMVTKKRV